MSQKNANYPEKAANYEASYQDGLSAVVLEERLETVQVSTTAAPESLSLDVEKAAVEAN